MHSFGRLILFLIVGTLLLTDARPGSAQDLVVTQVEEARALAVEVRRARSASPKKVPSKPNEAKPKPGEDDKKPGEKKKKEEKKAESTGPAPITRPPAANTPADPVELEIRPDKEGKINLQMRGQKWVDVLQMLADWSNLALDWTELPGDAVNLTTTKKYTLDEARDTFNRLLLDRGYTMLLKPELGTLSVHKIDKLNLALLPRVAPEDLEKRDPHELVKVSFGLGDWINAEEAVKDFEHMKSANGKLNALKATNRLEAVDAVVNLIQIRNVLTDEGSASGKKQRIRWFQIKYRNASDVEEMLRGILGLESKEKGPAVPMNRDQIRMQMEMAKMQAQNQQKKGATASTKPKVEVRLVVNRRENTILVFAPPEQMAIVEQAIEAVDIPTDQDRSLRNRLLKFHSYKLASMDPAPLVNILEEVGQLDFNTTIKIDEKNNAIVAYATLADHVTIRSLIDKLDGSGRRFYVKKLRRLKADYVAGTIEFMMGAAEEENQGRSRYYNPWYSRRNNDEDKTNKFSVDADIENNWLLLRANESEMKEIEDLLVQLGEIRVPGSNRSTVRYIRAPAGEATEAMLERIRRIWPSIAPNELNVDPPEEKPEEKRDATTRRSPAPSTAPRTGTTQALPRHAIDRLVLNGRTQSWSVQLAQLSSSAESQPDIRARENNSPSDVPNSPDDELLRQFLQAQREGRGPDIETRRGDPPPISVTRDPDGRITISSQDTRALDLLEELIIQNSPPPRKYEVFRLRYADALDVRLILKDFFEEKESSNNQSGFNRYYWGFDFGSSDDKSGRRRLSQRAPVKFIDDFETNSILVQNADAAQLHTIKELIEFYDHPEPPDSQTVRRMKFFSLRYANAEKVVDRVKEVFVDLLTPNDKARQKNQKEGQAERVYNYNFGDSDDDLRKVPKYKGQLLISADSVSNTVVVLAPGYVLDPVEAMILHLDRTAQPSSTVRVLKVDRLNPAQVQLAISKLLGQGGAQAPKDGADKSDNQGEGGERGAKGGRQNNGGSAETR